MFRERGEEKRVCQGEFLWGGDISRGAVHRQLCQSRVGREVAQHFMSHRRCGKVRDVYAFRA